MSDPKKWWLISDEDVRVVRRGLMGRALRRVALHALDSGLHETDEIPKDFRPLESTAKRDE